MLLHKDMHILYRAEYFDTWRSVKGIGQLTKTLQTIFIDGHFFVDSKFAKLNSDTVQHSISVY